MEDSVLCECNDEVYEDGSCDCVDYYDHYRTYDGSLYQVSVTILHKPSRGEPYKEIASLDVEDSVDADQAGIHTKHAIIAAITGWEEEAKKEVE